MKFFTPINQPDLSSYIPQVDVVEGTYKRINPNSLTPRVNINPFLKVKGKASKDPVKNVLERVAFNSAATSVIEEKNKISENFIDDYVNFQQYSPDGSALPINWFDVHNSKMREASTAVVNTYSDYNDLEGANSQFAKTIRQIESGNNYQVPLHNKSSAVGAYQFIWGQHGDKIKEITGVKSKQEFRNNKELQDKFFNYWDENVLTPESQQLEKYNNGRYNKAQLKALVHFKGLPDAKKYLKTNQDSTQKNNISIPSYLKRFK